MGRWRKWGGKLALVVVLAGAVALLWAFGGERYLAPEFYQQLYQDYPQWSLALYFVAYVIITALSIPGAVVMTLAGGAIFGFGPALLAVSFASSLGALLAFLLARTLLKDWVQRRFGNYLGAINRGFDRDGAFYLFTLRLIPIFPFFVINLLMGLLPMRAWTFYWVSQLGMLPGTMVYVNAGAQLGEIDSLSASGILTPELIGAFVLLGLFPYVARALVRTIQRLRLLRQFPKPQQFDANLLVIGGGSAGLVSAYIAATVKAKAILVERAAMGGDCLNTGCVPSKALIRSARLAADSRRASALGLSGAPLAADFPAVMERVQAAVDRVAPHDSVDRYEGLGVRCVSGTARLVSPWEVKVDGRRLRAEKIVLATGGRPVVPEIPGLERIDALTSDNLWQVREQPRRLLVIGGGPIGCELAQAFAQLGTAVTLVQQAERLLPREDPAVSAQVQQQFAVDGIEVLLQHRAVAFSGSGAAGSVTVQGPEGERELGFDRVLLAVGRRANTDNLGLEALGISLREDGTVAVDDYLQTRLPTVYACGDVTGPYQFTHVSAHQAWYAAVNALFGGFKGFRVDYRVIPWVTFTRPEVARVGLNETEARERGIAVAVTRFDLEELDRAIADGANHGFVQVLTPPGKDRILGVTIVAEHAGEMLAEWVLAMKHGIGLNKLLGTIHVYPTWSEANKYAAGEWKKAHAPTRLLQLLGRYFNWRRR